MDREWSDSRERDVLIRCVSLDGRQALQAPDNSFSSSLSLQGTVGHISNTLGESV